jgi:hypothetical protein
MDPAPTPRRRPARRPSLPIRSLPRAFGVLGAVALTAPALAAESREVVFDGHGGFELKATLLVPDDRPEGGAPALLLLPGSGPTDRNGNQPPLVTTDLVKSVAESLGEAGVATLRFDKRAAHVYLEHILALGTDEQNDFLSWESFVGDARAALAFLRGADGIDPTRVGILGHSEGGLFALQVAKDLGAGEDGVAALVLAATPAVPMVELIPEQLERQLTGYPEPLREKFLEEFDRAARHVIEHGSAPEDLDPSLAVLFPANAMKLLQVELALEPTSLAATYAGPVLVLQGENDVQVRAESAKALADAFPPHTADRREVALVPRASHNFKHVVEENDPGFRGEVVSAALERLTAWLEREL